MACAVLPSYLSYSFYTFLPSLTIILLIHVYNYLIVKYRDEVRPVRRFFVVGVGVYFGKVIVSFINAGHHSSGINYTSFGLPPVWEIIGSHIGVNIGEGNGRSVSNKC